MCWTSLNHGNTSPPTTKMPTTTTTTTTTAATTTATETTQDQKEIDAILSVTTGFLSALSSKSRDAFDQYCIRAGGMSLWPPPPTIPPRFCTIGSFVEQMAKLTDDIDERIWDPEVKVAAGGEGLNLASVWAPFRAVINGVVHHVGVEVFVLHKVDGVWKVTGMADSCRFPTEEEKMLLL